MSAPKIQKAVALAGQEHRLQPFLSPVELAS